MRRLLPGLLLVTGLALVARAGEGALAAALGRAPVEALVLAIGLGIAVRAARPLASRDEPGVTFAGRELLELSVVLLGASADLSALARAGLPLAAGITALVAVTVVAGTWWGRALGLTGTQALLLACGNAICGNSAIAAVAPVLQARREDVAAAVAYTAVLGVAVIVGLPWLQQPLALSDAQYGVVVGLTVYAVPQVLAAAFPVSAHAGQVGMLVKLARVLLLGPLVLALTVWRHTRTPAASRRRATLLPWFVVGFVVTSAARTAGVVPDAAATAAHDVAKWLTIASMASLGLGVELSAVRRAGPRVVVAVTGSLALLLAGSVLLARSVPLP